MIFGSVGDGAGQGQRLQDTDGSGGALDDAGEDRADEQTQNGVVEGGQHARELFTFGERFDGLRHEGHAEHQNGEAAEDGTDVFFLLLFGLHDETDADERDDGREVCRFQQRHENVVRLDAAEGQDPRGQRGADVRAHDDTDGVGKLHDAGVDETDEHDGEGRGRLDGDGDGGTQREALPDVGCEPLQDDFQLAAGDLFQVRGHDVHAEQEKGETSDHRQKRKYGHSAFFSFIVNPVSILTYNPCKINRLIINIVDFTRNTFDN